MRSETQSAHDPKEALDARLRSALGALAGRPLATHGVVTLAAGIPMTSANLAALEAAWHFEGEGSAASPTRRR
ncbi:MAG: hypothetical protein U1F43_00160 [Myxococcota bacterium]